MQEKTSPMSSTFELTILREEDAFLATEEFRQHVIEGLTKPFKTLSSKYFYDDHGSELYEKITEVDEYYLTRSEKAIFETHADNIVESYFAHLTSPEPINLVELGAGDGRKTKIILQALLKRKVKFEYIPIDISRQAMASLFEAMGSFFKDQPLKVHGVIGDYLESVQHVVASHPTRRTAILFIGSSIGNFEPESATSFLSDLRAKLNPRDILLLGCDLQKDPDVMLKAYSDSKGITTAFNLNLLTRMNRELGTDFSSDNFQHLALYNPRIGAMESYLVANVEHTVKMRPAKSKGVQTGPASKDCEFKFNAFETLHLECSYKFTTKKIHQMLKAAGFCVVRDYFDKLKWFVDTVAVN